ncbi:hypothetical protein Tco_0980353, partial [Tanacetum coccineum]
DPVRRLCHRMISCSIFGRGQVPEKVTGMLGGRKSGARLSRGYFIGRLAAHFGLRLGDTWAWVAPGPERQPNDAAGAPEAARDVPAVDEGPSADLAPMHAPRPPHAAPRTMP